MNIADKIKAVRKARGITPTVMARELGIEATNYPRLENRGNRLTYDNLVAICKALGITVVELLTWGDEEFNSSGRIDNKVALKLEKDLSRAEELLDYQKDKIRYFKKVIAEYIVDAAWEEFEKSTPDPIVAIEDVERGEVGFSYDIEAWNSFLSTYIFGQKSVWQLFEAGLLDDKSIEDYKNNQNIKVPFDIRMRQAKASKEADKLFGRTTNK